MLSRDWSDALDAWANVPCIVCGRWPRELAHVLGREYDVRIGARRKRAWVHPDSVVPLCKGHHNEYDAHRLDLWPFIVQLKRGQKVLDWCIERVGRGRATTRIRTRKYWETLSEQETSDGSDREAERLA